MPTEYTTKDIERFYAKVSKTPTERGCLEWTGYHNRLGYGYFKVGKKNIGAHRIAWEIVNGPIPAGLVIRHMCHNPQCVNPAHLRLGSQADNVRDMMSSGRWHNAPNTRAPYVKPVKPVRPTANRIKRVRPVKPVEERFYAKVSKTPNETGCLDWLAGHVRFGYGRFSIGGKSVNTHRLAWELVNGPVPDGLQVCHRCDRPICCNVEHLFLASPAENMQDKIRKGRANYTPCKGETVGTSKLTAAQVKEIRSPQYEDWAPIDIAAKFGVTNSCVCMILRRQSWAHLDSSGDAPIRDRGLKGERRPNAKLTEAAVLEIRSGRFEGQTHLEIAKHFGVVQGVISNVRNRKSWTHI